MSQNPRSVKDKYILSQDRIQMVLECIGKPDAQGKMPPIDTQKLLIAKELVEKILQTHENEPETSYKEVLIAVSHWLLFALDPRFASLSFGTEKQPSSHVIKKAVELLHMILHRDCRRKIPSDTEAQKIDDFLCLVGKYPDPERLCA